MQRLLALQGVYLRKTAVLFESFTLVWCCLFNHVTHHRITTVQRHCICAQLPLLDLPLDFVVLLHYKEYLRISNTGHLLPLMHKHDPATDTYVPITYCASSHSRRPPQH